MRCRGECRHGFYGDLWPRNLGIDLPWISISCSFINSYRSHWFLMMPIFSLILEIKPSSNDSLLSPNDVTSLSLEVEAALLLASQKCDPKCPNVNCLFHFHIQSPSHPSQLAGLSEWMTRVSEKGKGKGEEGEEGRWKRSLSTWLLKQKPQCPSRDNLRRDSQKLEVSHPN